MPSEVRKNGLMASPDTVASSATKASKSTAVMSLVPLSAVSAPSSPLRMRRRGGWARVIGGRLPPFLPPSQVHRRDAPRGRAGLGARPLPPPQKGDPEHAEQSTIQPSPFLPP